MLLFFFFYQRPKTELTHHHVAFDDGPGELSEEVDRALKQSGARASFFVNGNNAGCIYDYADELLSRFQAGHLIGCATDSMNRGDSNH